MKDSQRILSYDILRASCALIIIAFHYSTTISSERWHPLYSYANGNWGSLCVSIFFMISGASLFLGYKDRGKIEWLAFFKKRFLTLFPMFYFVWLFMYIINVYEKKSFFFAGSPIKIILSLIGMDGYFSYLGTNYYMNVGEWFLGALIWCYLFFPLLISIAKKSYWGGVMVGISLEIIMLSTDFFTISPIRNLITCVTSFFINKGIYNLGLIYVCTIICAWVLAKMMNKFSELIRS